METMEVERLMERDHKTGLWMFVVGAAAALLLIPDMIFGWFEPGYLVGIACGGLGGGLGTLIRHRVNRRHPEARKAYAAQFDERLEFIRHRAKSKAYDVTFYSLCGSVFFSSMSDWPAWQMAIVLMLIAFVSYMTGLVMLQRKY
jgi:hypothetical protein